MEKKALNRSCVLSPGYHFLGESTKYSNVGPVNCALTSSLASVALYDLEGFFFKVTTCWDLKSIASRMVCCHLPDDFSKRHMCIPVGSKGCITLMIF